MAATYDVRTVKALRLFCPIEAQTLGAMLAGDASALERDATLSQMLRILRGGSPLGDFGVYKAVVEVAPGWELFTPGDDAQPALGDAGSTTTSPTAMLTIYVADDAPEEAVDRALGALLAAHPWEIPVIEMSETSLLMRPDRATRDR